MSKISFIILFISIFAINDATIINNKNIKYNNYICKTCENIIKIIQYHKLKNENITTISEITDEICSDDQDMYNLTCNFIKDVGIDIMIAALDVMYPTEICIHMNNCVDYESYDTMNCNICNIIIDKVIQYMSYSRSSIEIKMYFINLCNMQMVKYTNIYNIFNKYDNNTFKQMIERYNDSVKICSIVKIC